MFTVYSAGLGAVEANSEAEHSSRQGRRKNTASRFIVMAVLSNIYAGVINAGSRGKSPLPTISSPHWSLGSPGALRADNVFAVEALAHGDAGLAGDAVVRVDGLEAIAFLGDMEDVAAVGPGGRDLGGEFRLGGK